jgi:shikimate kinase
MVRQIILIGFMASGKSAVAAELARRIGWRFVDFDREIEDRLGLPVGEIVALRGVGYLRRLEAELTREYARATEVVIAPGGGWITQPRLRRVFRREGVVVWLRVEAGEVARRLRRRAGRSPFAAGYASQSSIQELMERREALYRLADVAVCTTGLTPPEIVSRIQRLVRLPAPAERYDRELALGA